VIKELKKTIPTRIESQIRAHHLKMMRKYGTIARILMVSDRKENTQLLEINQRVTECLKKTSEMQNLLAGNSCTSSRMKQQ
jgi:hypothetical protein